MKKTLFFITLLVIIFSTCTLFHKDGEVIINDIGKLPESEPHYIDVVCDTSKELVKLIYEDGLFPEINKGDIIAGTKDEGYLVKVESKEEKGDTLIINGSSASLEEVIEKGFVDSTVALTVDITKSLKALNTQCKLIDEKGTEYTANVTSSTPTLKKMSENVFELTFTNIKLTFLSNNSSIEIPELKYKFDMDYNFVLQYDNGLKEFKSVLTTTDSILFDEIELNLLNVEGDIDVVELQLWKPVFKPIVFYIGGWPVIVTPELAVSLKGTLSSSASASLLIPVNLSIGKEETMGIEYTEEGGWSPVWDYDFSISGHMDSTDFGEDFNTTQKVGLFGKFGLKLYGAIGGGLNIGLYGYNKYVNNLSGSTATWADTMGVMADAGVHFGIGVEIGGLVKISLTLLEYEHTFASVKKPLLYFNNTEYYDGLPTVTTNSATNITTSSAQLNGTVNPNGLATTYYFEWDTTTNYNHTTPDSSAGSGTSAVPVSFNLTGLSAGKTYHYRIVATNSSGTSYGNDESFTTETTTTELVYIGTNTSGYEEYMNQIDSMIVIKIPAGNFTMGSDAGEGDGDEEPEHVVYISEYYIGKYEVTNKQYKKFCDATSRSYPPDPGFDGMSSYFTSYPDYPVINVNWYDAVAYCAWAGLRLPTEAEWEKASRGSADERTYPWGFTEPYYNGQYYCNYDKSDADGYYYTCPVEEFSIGKSPYGCYNMAGNVWEWVNDWYDGSYYSISPSTDPQGPTTGDYKVLRGGSWGNSAYCVRSAYRCLPAPSLVDNSDGFRCSAAE